MNRLFLLARIADTEVALSCEHIESVVNIGEIVPVPRSDPVVAGLIALRSRVLTLIDCQYRITAMRAEPKPGALAAIASVGGHGFGLLVDQVQEVIEIAPHAVMPASRLGPDWSPLVREVAEIEGRLVMIVDPASLLLVNADAEAAA